VEAALGVMQELQELSVAREAYRKKNGSVLIPNMECNITVDGMDDPSTELAISVRPLCMHESPTRMAVMEAMLLTGELAAKWGAERRLPLLYRCACRSVALERESLVHDMHLILPDPTSQVHWKSI
jgi:hypothetical protein